MRYHVDDITLHWLKVRNEAGRTYFVPWDQEPALAAMNVLAVVPADPKESPELTVMLGGGESPRAEGSKVISSSLRDAALMKRWRKERRKLELQGTLEPLAITIHKAS